MNATKRVHLKLLPYLPLHSRVSCGPWELIPLHDKNLTWEPSSKDILKLFVSKFRDARGKQVVNPALIARMGEPFDGSEMSYDDYRCVQLAVQFGCVNQNDPLVKELNFHHHVTAENGAPVVWQFDRSNGYITLSAGSLLKVMDGGWKLDDQRLEIRSHPDIYTPTTSIFMPSDLIDATYKVAALARETAKANHADAVRICRAINWCNKASQNATTLDVADRIVMLKTGFEALTGTSKSTESATRLLEIFETIRKDNIAADDRLLWRPHESKKYLRHYWDRGARKQQRLTPLEHWFLAFSDARNRIIHDGETAVSFGYKHGSSPFNGHMFRIGQWTLRLAIRIEMTSFGYGGLWRTAVRRRWRHAFAGVWS